MVGVHNVRGVIERWVGVRQAHNGDLVHMAVPWLGPYGIVMGSELE